MLLASMVKSTNVQLFMTERKILMAAYSDACRHMNATSTPESAICYSVGLCLSLQCGKLSLKTDELEAI